ncbi:hypothetical protein [Mesorhizobium sp. M0199]|uniref:hypothetical protein n=1 Tax=Mesorhizobium sp. M0199 TaxID=2956911 RepID=UPI00333AE886
MNTGTTSTTEVFLAPPQLSREILAYLRQVFRNRLPDLTVSDRELGAKIGEQRVIDHLAAILQNQEEDLLANVLQQAKD